jgi:peptidoglycan/LPS O-acetylase OafA/YrhL
MPEPVSNSQRYLPGLDGLRALAVGAVVAYHMDLGWAQGGLLGVGVFFTLSGYLITDLLLGQYERTGGLQLAAFWLRRARRLLPALFVMLTVVVAWVTLLDRSLLPAVRGAVGASAVYVTNWWLIVQHSSYFAQFAPPSPLGHLWSLAVEEQFYLIWPWLLWIGLRWKRKGAGSYQRLAAASLLLAAA